MTIERKRKTRRLCSTYHSLRRRMVWVVHPDLRWSIWVRMLCWYRVCSSRILLAAVASRSGSLIGLARPTREVQRAHTKSESGLMMKGVVLKRNACHSR